LDGEGRQLREQLVARRARSPGERRLGGADDEAVLVYPDAAGHVHDAEQLVEQVRLVDERGVRALGARDPRRRRLRAAGVERDALSAAASSLRFDLPSGAALEFGRRYVEAREDHLPSYAASAAAISSNART